MCLTYLDCGLGQVELGCQFAASGPRHVVLLVELLLQPRQLVPREGCAVASHRRIRWGSVSAVVLAVGTAWRRWWRRRLIAVARARWCLLISRGQHVHQWMLSVGLAEVHCVMLVSLHFAGEGWHKSLFGNRIHTWALHSLESGPIQTQSEAQLIRAPTRVVPFAVTFLLGL